MNLGDPSWIFIVGAPSTGKTVTAIAAATELPEIRLMDDLTPNTFLSGFYGHDAPGVLENLGGDKNPQQRFDNVWRTQANGIFLWPDWTVMLSLPPASRDQIYGQLRRIYDGSLQKATGTGITKCWEGRITIVAAVTNAIELERRASMGDRFMSVSWPRCGHEAAVMSLKMHMGKKKIIDASLKETCKSLFQVAGCFTEIPKLSDNQIEVLARMADFAAHCRADVKRSGYGGELLTRPDPEGPPRIAQNITMMAIGVATMYRRTHLSEREVFDAMRLGFDSIPRDRGNVIQGLLRGQMLSQIELNDSLKARAYTDLCELGILDQQERFTKKANDMLDVIGRETFTRLGKDVS